jgi:hypothetical protein
MVQVVGFSGPLWSAASRTGNADVLVRCESHRTDLARLTSRLRTGRPRSQYQATALQRGYKSKLLRGQRLQILDKVEFLLRC